MNLDQEAVDWHIVHEAVSDAIDNAEGKPGRHDLQRAFKKHGLRVLHEEDVGAIPDREAFWLLERNVSPPQYLTDGRDMQPDPWRAMRFTTERNAHDFWRTWASPFRDECRPVEHVFINRPATETA